MSKLLRLTLMMVGFGLVLIYGTRLLGNAQPGGMEPPFINTGGVPSLFGVQPGVTSYSDALELLRTQQLTPLVVPKRIGDMFGKGSMRVILTQNTNDDLVARIELVAAQNSEWSSFGQLVALLGPPQRVVVERGYTQSFWHGGQLEFFHEHHLVGFVGLDDPLESMAVNDKPGEIPANAVRWQGFGSVEAYLSTKAQ